MRRLHDDMLDALLNTAASVLNSDGSISPYFYVSLTNGQEYGFGVNWEDYASKQKVYEALRLAFQAAEVESFIFISEGWATRSDATPKELQGVLEGQKRVSELPDRVRTLLIFYTDHESHEMYSYTIKKVSFAQGLDLPPNAGFELAPLHQTGDATGVIPDLLNKAATLDPFTRARGKRVFEMLCRGDFTFGIPESMSDR